MSVPGYSQVPTQTRGQQNLLAQLIEMLQGTGAQGFEQGLQSLLGLVTGSPESFEAFEAPLLRQFEEETLPQITERLTAQGAGGGRSSAAPQILGRAGERLTENLAAQRAQLQQSAIQRLIDTYLRGTQGAFGVQPFAYQQQAPGFGTSVGSGVGLGVGSALSQLLRRLF